ncbi:LPXTG cell wall anchor domain-containing protein [Leuconostoc gelidum]|uniref:LPXTG cell wall anchor domain-containing protein n=1 Tax=Leuconostoc gelidum TaxID=1244 RepID=UPI001C7DC140|nr:LPXTG cell wall anchor domain-containing protein [Leuconostoc gelidum]MBZ6009760.1 LPXTG cell wall anchor domain-containing protein [Leuconostoc gelidum subsp. aenigmaticum]
MTEKKYKLYKDGKHLVIGAIAVAGIMTTTGVSHANADTITSNDTTKAVQTTGTTKQDDKQVALQPTKTVDTPAKTVTTEKVKSDVATSVPTNTSQDEAKSAVDQAQETVKSDVDTASKAGADVTTGKATDVTINDDNASSKTNEVLTDLNKQDQAVKDATAKQQANDQAYKTATTDQKEATTKGQTDLNKATDDLDKQVDETKKSGIDVNVALTNTSPKYQVLTSLTGQDLLNAMAKNIDLYKQAIASGVTSETADKIKLEALVKEYQQKQADFEKAKMDQANTVKQGQANLDKATTDLNKQIDETKKAGIEVSIALSKTSPKYQSLSNLTGQDLLNAMAKNIDLYKQAIASGVKSENADKLKLEALVKEYQQKQADFSKAKTDQSNTVKQGQTDLAKGQANLDKAVAEADKAGIKVTTALSQLSPEYKSLKGLVGQEMLDAMAKNITLYKQAISSGVATQSQEAKTLQALTSEYKQAVATYQAEKAKIDQSNADKKAAYEKALNKYLNATDMKTIMQAQTDTDMDSGQYQTFMTSDVDQQTGEFSLKHDMNDGVSIIGRGELKGKVNYQVISNGDGTETIKVTSIDLYSYTYTNLNYNTAVNQNINFHVYDNNGTELYSRYHDGQSSFSDTINKNFSLSKSIKLTPGQQSDLFSFLNIDDNWVWNTHGQVYIAFQNTNKAPDLPKYDAQPKTPVAPTASVHKIGVTELPVPEAPVAPKASVTKVTVDELPQAEAPVAPKTNVTKVTVEELPQAETPAPQKIDVHYYNIKKTPKVEKTATAVTPTPTPAPVATANILPHTGENENNGSSILGVIAGMASLGLIGAVRKFKKQ